MRWESRLKRLEANFSEMARRTTELRVAGQSRSEFFAETLALLFCPLEAAAPGVAAILVAAVKNNEQVPSDECEEIKMMFGAVRNFDRINPGLPERVLKAVQDGAEAITEEVLFPNGRPIEEQGYCYRQGMRFYCRLDTIA